jgi:UDP-N-acetylglucosamine--N-acetylmuramyl-(pentapeptide) pyrophosphoryl-undecaprenol N-acetylglucosamine transferase
MRVIIAGGGTGGHLFPAVAVGEELKRERPDVEVLYVGASNGMEARWLPQHGLPHELLVVRGWTGKGVFTRLRALSEFIAAIGNARRLLKRFDANLVVAAGGYASAPMAVAAIFGRIPLVMMEQNVRPGISNRLLWRFTRKICVGFDESATAFAANKVEITGNPVRFTVYPQPRKPTEPLQILVLGGSSGAHRLNVGVLKAFKISRDFVIKLAIVHQTGEADVALVADGYRDLGREARVVAFIDDIAAALDAADLVIARSGAMTVSEVALAGRPAIFVPYPFHSDRQQELNARVLERRGAARIVLDDDHLGENLATAMWELVPDPAELVAMGAKARHVAHTDAAAKIARICFDVAASPERHAA